MDSEKRFELITKDTEEVLTLDGLNDLLDKGVPLNHYIGFEISGFIHLGTGLCSTAKIKDFLEAGVKCTIFLADWHTWINDKLGGNHEVIKRVAGGYFKEGLKASMLCWGGDPEKINFILGSDLYSEQKKHFWETMIDVSKNINLSRIERSITIMGRNEGGSIDFAKLIYPPMQVADIFTLQVNLAHAGMDQRKAHVIALDVASKMKRNPLEFKGGKYKPIAIHHSLLMGLQAPPKIPSSPEEVKEVIAEMKMSKSIPKSAIFIHDSPEEIRTKVGGAFCPEGNVDYNPILQWSRLLLFRQPKFIFKIERPEKFGGNVSYDSYAELEKDFKEKKLHPLDLKKSFAEELIRLLEPARKHFAQPKVKKMWDELKELKVTR